MVVLYILLVFAVIVFLLQRRASISVAMLAGAAVLGLTFAPGPGRFARAVWESATAARTLDLMGVVALIMILSHLLSESGQFRRMMDALGGLVRSRRVRLASMPALIGLLPMPGGARFSAPMVEAAGEGMGLNVHRLSLINYWFRHIWEYSWPIYPGILLASTFVPGGIARLAPAQFPLTLVAVVTGAIFVLPRRLPANDEPHSPSRKAAAREFFANALPIFTVVILFGMLSAVARATGVRPVPKNLPMMAALAVACGMVLARNRLGLGPVVEYAFKTRRLGGMLLMVLSVMIFSGVFKRLGASAELGEYLSEKEIPSILLVMALPFAVGLLTSVTYVYVALTFPLVSALVPGGAEPMPYLVLAFCFGFLGCLLSPMHLCLLLTKEYFRADFKPIYRDLLVPVSVVAAAGVGLFLLLK